ncbi:phosphopantetheine-binding protein, partial [Bacillus thuringiensis]
QNSMEEMLLGIFKKVLNIDQLGVNELFFHIGGDSIKAIQVSSRLNQLGYYLDVKHLLSNLNIRQLSAYVTQKNKNTIMRLFLVQYHVHRFKNGFLKKI